jgi:hypothetical protein
MRSRVAFMARRLTGMSRDGGTAKAAVPFTLPSALHPPEGEAERWTVHRERTAAAIAKVEEMQQSDAADGADPYLESLLASDRARLAFIDAGPPPGSKTSFARDIRPLFRPKDIKHMADLLLDLSEYEAARAEAQTILERVSGTVGRPMPPPPDQRWTKVQIELFERWIAEGFPE